MPKHLMCVISYLMYPMGVIVCSLVSNVGSCI